jgi:hypothetical protein
MDASYRTEMHKIKAETGRKPWDSVPYKEEPDVNSEMEAKLERMEKEIETYKPYMRIILGGILYDEKCVEVIQQWEHDKRNLMKEMPENVGEDSGEDSGEQKERKKRLEEARENSRRDEDGKPISERMEIREENMGKLYDSSAGDYYNNIINEVNRMKKQIIDEAREESREEEDGKPVSERMEIRKKHIGSAICVAYGDGWEKIYVDSEMKNMMRDKIVYMIEDIARWAIDGFPGRGWETSSGKRGSLDIPDLDLINFNIEKLDQRRRVECIHSQLKRLERAERELKSRKQLYSDFKDSALSVLEEGVFTRQALDMGKQFETLAQDFKRDVLSPARRNYAAALAETRAVYKAACNRLAQKGESI